VPQSVRLDPESRGFGFNRSFTAQGNVGLRYANPTYMMSLENIELERPIRQE
jgi:hypothetical protein